MLSVIATFHFSPTDLSTRALRSEGAANESIVQTGNTVIDTVQWMLAQPPPHHPVLQRLRGTQGRVVLVTSHRCALLSPAP